MIDPIKLRRIGRRVTGAGCLAFIAGGAVMFMGEWSFGDALMIAGAVMLVVGVTILVNVPTGDKDAR